MSILNLIKGQMNNINIENPFPELTKIVEEDYVDYQKLKLISNTAEYSYCFYKKTPTGEPLYPKFHDSYVTMTNRIVRYYTDPYVLKPLLDSGLVKGNCLNSWYTNILLIPVVITYQILLVIVALIEIIFNRKIPIISNVIKEVDLCSLDTICFNYDYNWELIEEYEGNINAIFQDYLFYLNDKEHPPISYVIDKGVKTGQIRIGINFQSKELYFKKGNCEIKNYLGNKTIKRAYKLFQQPDELISCTRDKDIYNGVRDIMNKLIFGDGMTESNCKAKTVDKKIVKALFHKSSQGVRLNIDGFSISE